jgi:pyruvate/2-oxoglutarate dehydrogenase complex dihydrolipoamide dehydrogenase (E3) component
MTRVGRAGERGETPGFMKVLVDAQTERILGAALLCIDGDEIVIRCSTRSTRIPLAEWSSAPPTSVRR